MKTVFPISLPLLSRVLFAVAIVFITVLTLLPMKESVVTTGWDKTNHVLAFFVLLWLADWSWASPATMWAKLIALMAYGLLIEMIQSVVPERAFSIADLFSDALGLSVYLMLRTTLLPLQTLLQGLPFIRSLQPSGGEP